MPRSADLSALLAAVGTPPRRVVTEEDMGKLPPPVQACLLQAGAVGKPIPSTVRLRQRGRLKLKADGKWYSLEAEQYFTTDPPGFLWEGRVALVPFWKLTGKDLLVGADARMTVRLLPFVKVVDVSGPTLHRAELIRYLSEMMWFPAAFVLPCLSWEPLDDSSARAVLHSGETPVSGVFHMSSEGAVTRFVAERPYEVKGRPPVPTMWSTPVTGYRDLAGLRLPAAGGAVWHLPEGDFTYIEVELTALEYDGSWPF